MNFKLDSLKIFELIRSLSLLSNNRVAFFSNEFTKFGYFSYAFWLCFIVYVAKLKRTRDRINYIPKWKIPPFNTSRARTIPIRLAQIFFIVWKLQLQLKSNSDFVSKYIFFIFGWCCYYPSIHPISLPLKLFITVLIPLKFNSKLFAIALKLRRWQNQNGNVDTAKLITTRTGYSFEQMYSINISGRKFQGCEEKLTARIYSIYDFHMTLGSNQYLIIVCFDCKSEAKMAVSSFGAEFHFDSAHTHTSLHVGERTNECERAREFVLLISYFIGVASALRHSIIYHTNLGHFFLLNKNDEHSIIYHFLSLKSFGHSE